MALASKAPWDLAGNLWFSLAKLLYVCGFPHTRTHTHTPTHTHIHTHTHTHRILASHHVTQTIPVAGDSLQCTVRRRHGRNLCLCLLLLAAERYAFSVCSLRRRHVRNLCLCWLLLAAAR